jgi:hypothetical protein
MTLLSTRLFGGFPGLAGGASLSGTTAEHARHNLRQPLFAPRQTLTQAPFIVGGELVG